MADWTAKCTKIEEIARKKDELNNEFMSQTKEALHAKMEHCEEKRDAIITEVKEKLKVRTYIVCLRSVVAAANNGNWIMHWHRCTPRRSNGRVCRWSSRKSSAAWPSRTN